MHALDGELTAELDRLEAAGLRRSLRTLETGSAAEVRLDGRSVLLLSSNNYLGLADHPTVVAFRRGTGEGSVVVVINTAADPAEIAADDLDAGGALGAIAGTHRALPAAVDAGGTLVLRPFEACLLVRAGSG